MATLDQFAQAIRQLQKTITAQQARIDVLGQYIGNSAATPRPLQQWEELELKAQRVLPFWYNIDIALVAGTTARTPGSVQIISRGYFILKRLYFTWRVDATGEFHEITSRGNTDAANIDFGIEYVTTDSERNRQNAATPGDVFARMDRDGFLPTPDILVPATDVTFNVTPYSAVPLTGTFTVVMEGSQCLNVLEDA